MKFKQHYKIIFLALSIALVSFVSFPVVSKVLDSRRLQETNFELSILEFRGLNMTSVENPARAQFKYGDKLIDLKIMNKDLDQRIVVELPLFPKELSTHFLDGKLLISGGDISFDNPQVFPILLVRQPTANTRLEKMNKIIAQSSDNEESPISKQMGELIARLQSKYKVDFKEDTTRMDDNLQNISSELEKLNLSFDQTLEELENIDKELKDILS